MSSRLRLSVVTYFDVCCEVYIGDSLHPSSTKVLYPLEYNDESTLSSIRQFCFPIENDSSNGNAVQLFTFVLTDAQSQYTFGYCRMMPATNTCLCILSGLTWTTHFYKFLNHLSTVLNNGTKDDVDSLLTNAYHVDIPKPGGIFRLNACTKIGNFVDDIPDLNVLPTLRTDKYMLEFYNAVTEKQMIPLYASLLKERRIIFTGRKLSQLSSCVFALSKLLYPFHWQNLFIPVLPKNLIDMLMAPMPYIIGVPKQTFEWLNKSDLGEVVVVDLEEKSFESSNTDILPTDAASFLRSQLKSVPEIFVSDGMARSFLQTNVLIFGKYLTGFVREGEKFVWDKQVFINNQRSSIQPFLTSIISKDGVQYFERFIDDRLTALNNGTPIFDEFEKELNSAELKRLIDRQNYPFLLQTRPEVFQLLKSYRAVSNVKENANDVIVALKDRVQAISIKEKFGRFTPKEVRRHKLKSSKPGKKKKLVPLSVDAAHYNFNDALIKKNVDSQCVDTKSEEASDAESVCSTGDLINFSDDNIPVDGLPSLTHNSWNTSSLQQLQQSKHTSNSTSQLNDLIFLDFPPKPQQQKQQPFSANVPATASPGQASTSFFSRKSNWETFE